MSASPSPPPPPHPPRRQFMFKRANLGLPDITATTDSIPDSTAFFSRREENYVAPVVAAAPKKTKRPKGKKKGTDGSPPKRVRSEDVEDGAKPKQRNNAIVLLDDDGHQSKGKGKAKPQKREVSLTPPPMLYVEFPADSPPPPTTAAAAAASSSKQQSVITLDTSSPEPAPEPEPISAEDALFARLEQRARAKAAAAAQPSTSNSTSAISPPPPDPIVTVLITSAIENTAPLMLRIRANQTLKAARTTWCQRQGFSAEQAAEVFLTWRGNKIFDHNSCGGVGIVGMGVEKDGNIHLEAMTVDGYEAMERERERQFEGEEEMPEVEEEKEVVVMRLVLKAKGVEDFKIKVRPETKISKLIAAYRISNKIPEEKQIRLDFDGDDLDPEDTIGDTELEDTFGIDVYIT